MSEPAAILVCALADAPRVVPGSVFHHRCGACGRQVMVAPSGQRILRELQPVLILCSACFEERRKSHDDKIELAAGTTKEALREARRAKPNTHRWRN